MSKIIESIPIVIKNQYTLLNLIAEGYKSLGKVLMEYIDNSLDSADDFFDDQTDRYSRDVLVEVTIDRTNNTISVKDNCEGMDSAKIRGLANKINDSEKARREQKRAWVTGKFGLGAHAYRVFSEELTVTSKCIDSPIQAITIHRDSPDAFIITPEFIDESTSWTHVQLKNVEKAQMKSLKSEELKRDIETYFEGFLHRNVKISINDDHSVSICEPFNYDELSGFEISKVINSWYEGRVFVTVPEERGVIIRLKVCLEKIDRPPYFARKGRRINYISHLDSFIRKTEHHNKVWEHHLLTGYIEVQDNLEPVMTRDDFVAGKGKQLKRTGIYNEIVKLEDAIYSAIEVVNKDKSDASLRNLASHLTGILSDLAKEEELNLKYQQQGSKLKKGDVGLISVDPNGQGEYIVETPGEGAGDGPIVEPNTEIVRGEDNPDGTTEGRKIDRQKQGVQIAFSTLPSESRSHYGDGVITIFTSHNDFKDRKSFTHQAELGSMKVTARLASYLAAVISSEFKELFYQQKKLEPSRKDILNQQIDFIFKMEERMKEFVDMPLQSIGALT